MSDLSLKAILTLIDKASAPLRSIQRQSQSTRQALDANTAAVQHLQRTLSQGGSRTFNQDLQSTRSRLAGVKTGTHELITEYHHLEKVMGSIHKKSEELAQSFAKSRQAMRGDIAKTFLGAGGAGFAAYKFIQPSIDFDKQMSGVQAVLNLQKESVDLAMLRTDARQYGASSSFSAPQVAQAQFELGSGGFDVKQIHQALGGTLDLASAGKLDIAQAASIAIGTLNGFSLAATDIARMNDVMVETTNRTATSVVDLGETMKYAAPVAKQYGVSLEAAHAMTGLLGNANIKGSESGTALRAIMINLAAPAKSASDALASIKVNPLDKNGNLRDISTVLAEIQKKTSKLGSGKRLEIFSDIAGKEAASAFSILVDQTAAIDKNTGMATNQIKAMTDSLQQANGAAKRAADILKDNTAGDIEEMKGAWDDLGITIGDILKSDLRGFIQSITALINRVSAWAKANPELVRTIGKLAMQLLILKVGMLSVKYSFNLFFGTLFSMIASITKFALIMFFFNKVADKFGFGFGSRLKMIAKGVRILGKAFIFLARQSMPLVIQTLWALGAALMTNPIVLIITAIALVALLIYRYWGPIKAFFKGVWAGMSQALAPVKDTFVSLFGQMSTLLRPLKPLWDGLVSAFSIAGGVIAEMFQPFQATNDQLAAATGYGHSFGTALGIIIGVIGEVIAGIIQLGITIFTVLGTAIGTFIGWVATIGPKIASAFSGLYTQFTTFGGQVIQGLIDGLTAKLEALKSRAASIASGITGVFKNVLGIHSPSRVFHELGGFTMQGMGNGLLANANQPINAMTATSQGLIKAMDTSQIRIDRRPPISNNSVAQTGASSGMVLNITINAAAGMNEQQLAQLVAKHVQQAQRSQGRNAALYDHP